MADSFVNDTGLGRIWGKIKEALAGKAPLSHTHTKNQITDFPTSMPASDVYAWAKASSKPSYGISEIRGLQSALDGKAASSHTHTKSQITDFPSSMPASDVYSWAKASSKPSYAWSEITDKPTTFTPASHTQGEATLTWGGRNFAGTYGPVDSSMIPELSANRLAFGNPAGITIEYSRDGGSTWTDYGADDDSKVNLFSPPGADFPIGKSDSNNEATADYLLRVTINTGSFGVYTDLNKFMIYCSTNGSTGSYCSIDAALESTPTTFVNFANKIPISGWSGYNIINTSVIRTYGNSAPNQYGRLRFTFGCTGGITGYSGLIIYKIYGFGGVGWTAPSNLARTGHIYSIGSGQSVKFPGLVTATGSITATGFYVSSLRSLKENIEPTKVKAVELINSQEIVDFNYKADKDKVHKVGLIADDSDPLFLDKRGETVDLYNTCGILMKAVQELSDKVTNLENKLAKI